MRHFCAFLLLTLALVAVSRAGAEISEAQQKFREELSRQFQEAEKKNAVVVPANDGWLFFAAEFRLLSLGRFWGDDAAKIGRSHKPQYSDPIPAILDFQKQLKARGIELLLVPVPPKPAVYPEKILPGFDVQKQDPAPVLHRFYDELRSAGLDVLDLSALFIANCDDQRGPVFCRTDSHWSGVGCVLAAQAIGANIHAKIPPPAQRKEYRAEWKEVKINGDLVPLLAPEVPKSPPEKIAVRVVNEMSGAPIASDADSPVLLLGDSHTLVFHDFLAERSGLLDELAYELGFAPDVIGTRGSGATPVRLNLYRRSLKDPGYLAKKKIVIWCFAAREFTEAEQGWEPLPIAK